MRAQWRTGNSSPGTWGRSAMAKPYDSEMAALSGTLDWAMSADLSPLRQAVRTAKLGPLVSIGSGGSLTTAHALSYYHRLATGHGSTVLTPLESVATRLDVLTSTVVDSVDGGAASDAEVGSV